MSKNDYPGYERRRREFVRDIRSRNELGISYGCLKNLLFTFFILILILIFLYLYSKGQIGAYSGLNEGIYFLNCGLEFIGDFGLFCGNY